MELRLARPGRTHWRRHRSCCHCGHCARTGPTFRPAQVALACERHCRGTTRQVQSQPALLCRQFGCLRHDLNGKHPQIDPLFGTPGDAVWADLLVDGDIMKELDLRDVPDGTCTARTSVDKRRRLQSPV
eukprot:scaffold1200_cov383-Prasinococcus_capsulatus_cf.AAC.6